MLVEVREANKSQHYSGHVKQMFHGTNETMFCGEMMQELNFFGKSIVIIFAWRKHNIAHRLWSEAEVFSRHSQSPDLNPGENLLNLGWDQKTGRFLKYTWIETVWCRETGWDLF